jgi:hypothetical protein
VTFVLDALRHFQPHAAARVQQHATTSMGLRVLPVTSSLRRKEGINLVDLISEFSS